MQNFMFVSVSVIEILEFNRKRKKKNMAKLRNIILEALRQFYKILQIFSRFQHVLHFDIGRSQIE